MKNPFAAPRHPSLIRVLAPILLVAAFVTGCSRASSDTSTKAPPVKEVFAEVNVYSGRHYDSDIAIYDAFTRDTGIKVNIIEASGDALIERIAREADASPADVFITADAGMLWRAKQRGILRALNNESILDRVPARYRDSDKEWVALSKRARIIIYNKKTGAPSAVQNYEDLSAPPLKGQVCARSSTNIYNQSLLADLIERDGATVARDWAKGVVANFARPPEGNDTSQIEAVAAGVCRYAIVNSYYLARYIGAEDEKMRMIGDKVGYIFPNQATTGTHVNVSGAGVARFAPNPENAESLIAFLLTDASQQAFAAGNNEYPVVEGVAAVGPIGAMGAFRPSDLDVSFLGRRQAEALKIFDEAGWQ